jgi:CxxC motif-containing protein
MKEFAMPEFVCIACPIGCRLTVERTPAGEVTVHGNRCPKGETFGREETLSPKRVVTAIVRTDSRSWPCIPVRTDQPLPRELIAGLIADLARQSVHLPAACGDTLMENYQGSGVNVVITRTLPPSSPPTPAPFGAS